MSIVRSAALLVWEGPQTALGLAMLAAEAVRKRVRGIEVEDGRLGYYDGFPENWADRLGGVRREKGRS